VNTVDTTTASTTRKGAPTMDTTATAETTEAPATPVPATFLPGPQAAACDNAWCTAEGQHADCYGPEVGLPSPEGDGLTVLTGQLSYDAEDDAQFLLYQLCADDWQRVTSDELRAETARVRAHLARLDALADQYDAIREAGEEPVAAQVPASGHFAWCVPGGCQVISEDDGQPYTMHEGAHNDLPNRGRHSGRTESLLSSALYYEDALADGPNLCVSFYDEGTPYSAHEADALIADLEAFVTGLKAQRAQLDEKPAAR
jgi:hypothetical protein